ncbi:hypothetical protein [Mycoplasma buteonis]|uniref:hypothetical protein n=1 Tax=Mycoplasma buteonis TaxID=171280 RepID=UPI000564D04F|nr:hypothetical protein [Mycoplasma buteonis]
MTKKSKYLLLGVSGILVGTAVVAIPVAVTSSIKANEEKERQNALDSLQVAVENANVKTQQVEGDYATPTEFDGWRVNSFNLLGAYNAPAEVQNSLDAVKKIVNDIKGKENGGEFSTDDIKAKEKELSAAVEVLESAQTTAKAETKDAVEKLQSYIDSLPQSVRTGLTANKNVKDATDAISNNLIKTATQAKAVYVLIAQDTIKENLSKLVFEFFNNSDKKDEVVPYNRVLLDASQDITKDNYKTYEYKAEVSKARYQDSETVAIFSKLLNELRDAMGKIESADNIIAYIQNVKIWNTLPDAANLVVTSYDAAVAQKAKVNAELAESKKAYEDANNELTKLVANGVYSDDSVVVTLPKPANAKAEDAAPTQAAKAYTAEQQTVIGKTVFTDKDLSEASDKITSALYNTAKDSVLLVNAKDNFALQKNFYTRAAAHAHTLINKGEHPVQEVTTAYSSVEGYEAKVTELENSLKTVETEMADKLSVQPEDTTDSYTTNADLFKSHKETVNAAIQKFVTDMTQALADKYAQTTATMAANKKLYRLISTLVAGKVDNADKLASDFENLTKAQADLVASLKLYVNPTNLFPGKEETLKAVAALVTELKGKEAVEAAKIVEFDKALAAATEKQQPEDTVFGLVNTTNVKDAIELYTSVNELLTKSLAEADKKAKELITKYLEKLTEDKNNTLKQSPFKDVAKENLDAFNAVMDKDNAIEGNEKPSDYELAENGYKLAVEKLDTYGQFKYNTYLDLVNAINVAADAAKPALAQGQYVPAVAEYNPAALVNAAKDAAAAKVALVKYTKEDLLNEEANNPTQYEQLFNEAVELLKNAIKDVDLDSARYDYEKSIHDTDYLAKIYYDYERNNAKDLYKSNIAAANQMVAEAKKSSTLTVDTYKKAAAKVQNAVWISNTAADWQLADMKQQAIDTMLLSIKRADMLVEIQLQAQKLQSAKKAADLLAKALEPKFEAEKSTAETAKANAEKAKNEAEIKTQEAAVKAAEAKIAALAKYKELVNKESSTQSPEKLAEYISKFQKDFDENSKKSVEELKDEFDKGAKFKAAYEELKAATEKLLADTHFEANEDYNNVLTVDTKDTQDTLQKRDAELARKVENENKFKIYRDTQALLDGILKPEFKNAEALKTPAENKYTKDDLIAKSETQPNAGYPTVRQDLVNDITDLGQINGYKELSDSLMNELEAAKTPEQVDPIYEKLLAPVKEAYQASLEELKNYRANDIADSKYRDAQGVADKALKGVTDYSKLNNQTFKNYVVDTKKLQDALVEAKYYKAKQDILDKYNEVQEFKKQLQNNEEGKALIDQTVYDVIGRIHAEEAKKYVELVKTTDNSSITEKRTALLQAIEKSGRTPREVQDAILELDQIFNAEKKMFNEYMSDKFVLGAPAMTEEYIREIKELEKSVLNAKVAPAYKEFNDFVKALEKEITIPSKTDAADQDYGLLYAQKDTVRSAIDAAVNKQEELQNRAQAEHNPVEAEKIYSSDKVKELTVSLRKTQYDAYKARVTSFVPLFATIDEKIEEQNVSLDNPLNADIKKANDQLTTALNQENITNDQKIAAYKAAYEALLKGFKDASSKASKALQTSLLDVNNNDIQAAAKSVSEFADGTSEASSENVKEFTTKDGSKIPATLSSIKAYIKSDRQSNFENADDKLVLMLMNSLDDSHAWSIDTSITNKQIKALIHESASMFVKGSSDDEYTAVLNKDKRTKLIERIYDDATAMIISEAEKTALLEKLFGAFSKDKVKEVREALERAEILSEARKAYHTALDKAEKLQNKSEAETTQINNIKADIQAKDVEATPTEELEKAYQDNTALLDLLNSTHELNDLIATVEDITSLIPELTRPNVGVFAWFTLKDDAKQDYLQKWNADEHGKKLFDKINKTISDYNKNVAAENATTASKQALVSKTLETLKTDWATGENSITQYTEKIAELAGKLRDAAVTRIKKYAETLKDNTKSQQEKQDAQTQLPNATNELIEALAYLQYVSPLARQQMRESLSGDDLTNYNNALKQAHTDMKTFLTTLSTSNLKMLEKNGVAPKPAAAEPSPVQADDSREGSQAQSAESTGGPQA